MFRPAPTNWRPYVSMEKLHHYCYSLMTNKYLPMHKTLANQDRRSFVYQRLADQTQEILEATATRVDETVLTQAQRNLMCSLTRNRTQTPECQKSVQPIVWLLIRTLLVVYCPRYVPTTVIPYRGCFFLSKETISKRKLYSSSLPWQYPSGCVCPNQ